MDKNMEVLQTLENCVKKEKQAEIQAFMVEDLADMIIATTPGLFGTDTALEMQELWPNKIFVPGHQIRQQGYLMFLKWYFADDGGMQTDEPIGCTVKDIRERAKTLVASLAVQMTVDAMSEHPRDMAPSSLAKSGDSSNSETPDDDEFSDGSSAA
jgi:hypothetical protein